MDRRHFIKLTAISGTTAALTACGNPENQIIRFIPEEELVPGIATWKPSVCPLCNAGCGVIARVMEGDAEVFRNGQAGVIRMGLVKKLEGNPEDPISQGKLCARGQAALQVTYHPDRLDKPRKRSGERGSGQFVDISWDEAIKELTGQLDALVAANDQKSLAFLTKPRRGRRLELVAQLLQRYGAPAPVDLRVVFRRGAATRERDQFRRAPVADVRSRAVALRRGVRRGSPRHLEFPAGSERGVWPHAAGSVPARARSSFTWMRGCRRRRPTPTSSWRFGQAPTVCSRWASRGRSRCSAAARRIRRRRNSRPRKWSSAPGVPAAKVERLAREFAANGPGGGDHRRRPARTHQRAVQRRRRQHAQSHRRQRESTGRRVVHPDGRADADAAPRGDLCRATRRRCCSSTM